MIQLFLFILIVLILSKKYTTLEHFKNNNNNNPIFSIIIPLYNNDQYIIATIKSVIYQTFKNFEIIIIDDKSTDKSFIKTQKFIKPYSNIKLLKNYKNRVLSVQEKLFTLETIKSCLDHEKQTYNYRNIISAGEL